MKRSTWIDSRELRREKTGNLDGKQSQGVEVIAQDKYTQREQSNRNLRMSDIGESPEDVTRQDETIRKGEKQLKGNRAVQEAEEN